jgi:hypothetical protein
MQRFKRSKEISLSQQKVLADNSRKSISKKVNFNFLFFYGPLLEVRLCNFCYCHSKYLELKMCMECLSSRGWQYQGILSVPGIAGYK